MHYEPFKIFTIYATTSFFNVNLEDQLPIECVNMRTLKMNMLNDLKTWYYSCTYGTIGARSFEFLSQTSPIISRLACVPEKAHNYRLLKVLQATEN